MVAALGPARRADRLDVEQDLLGLAVEEDRIVFSRVATRGTSAGAIRPDDLVHEV